MSATVSPLRRLVNFIDSDYFEGDPDVIRHQPERMEWGRWCRSSFCTPRLG